MQPEKSSDEEYLGSSGKRLGQPTDGASQAKKRMLSRGVHVARRGGAQAKGPLQSLAVIAGALVIWELVSLYMGRDRVGPALIPPPSEVFAAAYQLTIDGTLVDQALVSSRRVLLGWGITALVAIPLGIAMGRFRLVMQLAGPIVEALRPIPPIAWIPITILLLGIGDTQNLSIIVIGAFFPLLLNTIHGVSHVDPVLVRAARTLGASEWTILRKVIWYNALPSIFTGLRISLGVAWMCLVAAELVGSIDGLGFMMNDARNFLRSDIVITGMATIGLVGTLMDRIILIAASRLMPWIANPEGNE